MRAGEAAPGGPVTGRGLGRLLLLALVLAAGCRRAPSDEVAALLSELEAAAEARDVAGLEKRLTKEFTGAGGLPRSQVLGEARRYFALYEEVRLNIYGVERSSPDRIAFHIDFSGNAKKIGGLSSLLPPEAAYRFDCELVEEDGLLKLGKAEWKAVPLPGSEGEPNPSRTAG